MSQYYKKYLISGTVQGVWFRAATQQQARRHDVCGWVRNLANGQVEVLAYGDNTQLEQLKAWLWQGPPGAQVNSITEEPVTTEETAIPPEDFLIRKS